jgi:hypothetical protein
LRDCGSVFVCAGQDAFDALRAGVKGGWQKDWYSLRQPMNKINMVEL